MEKRARVIYTSPMEIVDIVDEENKVLYQMSKDEAHDKGLLHRTIIVEVRNSQGQWLLVKQAPHKQDKDQYVNPVGGHIKAGESEIEAIKRETEEETGIKVLDYIRIGNSIYNRFIRGKQENHFFIIYQITTDETPVLNDESVEYRWFTEKELKETIKNHPELFGDSLFDVLKKFYPKVLAG